MSIEKRFVVMLDDNIRDIENALGNKANELYVKLSKWKIFTEEITKLIKRKEKLEKDLEETKDAINKGQPLMSKYQYSNNKDQYVWDKALAIMWAINFSTEYTWWNYNNNNDLFLSELEIIKSMYDTKEVISMENFQAIAKSTRALFNMAATNKEARNILMSFQGKNWTALWINLPIVNPLTNFEITDDGTINMKALWTGK